MQGDVELGLGDNEQILAIGDKNPVIYLCMTALFMVAAIAMIFSTFIMPSSTTMESFYRCAVFIGAFGVLWFAKFLIDRYKYNQIYVTDKRIIITQKDRIEGIPFEEVQYFSSIDFVTSMIILKSKRKISFAYTNLKDVEKVFYKIFPQYEEPKIKIVQTIVIILVGVGIIAFNICHKFYRKYENSKYTKPVTQVQIDDAQSYMNYMQTTLKRRWSPPKLQDNAQVVVEFKIKRDGTIFDEKVIQTSGNREMDNSALFAINSVSPLRKLPDDLSKEDEVKINFTFDYNSQNQK